MSFSHKMINNFKRRSIKFPFSTKISLLNHFVLLLLCQNLTKALCKNFAINSTGNVAEQFAFNSEAGRWFLRELCDDAKHINKLSEFMRREHPSLEKVLINLHRNACANLKQNVGKSDDLKESLRSEFLEVLHGTKLPIRKTIDRLKQQIMNSNSQEAGANVKNVAKHCVLSRLKRGSNNSNEIQRANPMRGINKGITTSGKQFKLKIEKPPWQLIKIQNNHQGKSRGVEKQIEQSKNAKELVPFNGNSVPKCQLADKCEEKLAKWVKNKFVVLENRFHQISSIQTMGIDQIPKSILPAIESLQFLLENDQRIRAFVDAIFGEPESNTSKEIEKHDKMLELERNENLSKTQKQSEILIAADISKTSQNENGVKGIVKNVDSKGKGEIVASREHIRFWDCHRPLEQKQQRQTIPSTNDSQPFWRRIYNELRGNHPASSSTSTQQNGQNRHQTNANNEVWDDNWRYDPENSAYGALLGIQFPYLNYRKKRVIPALTPQKRQKIYACLVALTLIGLLLFVLGFTTKHGTVGHQVGIHNNTNITKILFLKLVVCVRNCPLTSTGVKKKITT